MTQAAKKQVAVAGRLGADGQFEVLALVDAPVSFVSSRLGPDVSRETKHEHDDERERVEDAIVSLDDEDAA